MSSTSDNSVEYSHKHSKYIDKLINNAHNHEQNHRHSAGFIQKSKMMMYGYNHDSAGICGLKAYQVHAEVACIINILKQQKQTKKKLNDIMKKYYTDELHIGKKYNPLIKGDIMVIRFGEMNLKNSKPCKKCAIFMHNIGIKNCFYSTYDNTFIKANMKTLDNIGIENYRYSAGFKFIKGMK